MAKKKLCGKGDLATSCYFYHYVSIVYEYIYDVEQQNVFHLLHEYGGFPKPGHILLSSQGTKQLSIISIPLAPSISLMGILLPLQLALDWVCPAFDMFFQQNVITYQVTRIQVT